MRGNKLFLLTLFSLILVHNFNFTLQDSVNEKDIWLVTGPEVIRHESEIQLLAGAYDTKKNVELEFNLIGTLRSNSNKTKNEIKKVVLKPFEQKLVIFEHNLLNYSKYDLEVTGPREDGQITTNRLKLRFSEQSLYSYIETDKQIYKPGETVHFRFIQINQNLLPIDNNRTYDIFVSNKKKYRLLHYKNRKFNNGIIYDTYKLDEKQALGQYELTLSRQGKIVKSKTFTVKEYVLPEIKIEIQVPRYVLYNSSVQVAVLAPYVHGGFVEGLLKFTAKQKYYYAYDDAIYWPEFSPKENYTLELPFKGFEVLNLNLTELLNLNDFNTELFIDLEAVLIDKLTNKTYKEVVSTTLIQRNYVIDTYFKNDDLRPGQPVEGLIRITDRNNEEKNLLTYDQPKKIYLQYKFDKNRNTKFIGKDYEIIEGEVEFRIDVPEHADDVYIRAKFEGERYNIGHLRVKHHESRSSLQLSILNEKNYTQLKNVKVSTGETIKVHLSSTKSFQYYTVFILNKNIILQNYLFIHTEPKKEHTFDLEINRSLSPQFKIIAFYYLDNSFVSDSIEIDIENVFSTSLHINIDKNEYKPGELININITTKANSFVGLLGLDESVLFLDSKRDFTRDKVLNDLRNYPFRYLRNYGELPFVVDEKKTYERVYNLFTINGLFYIHNGKPGIYEIANFDKYDNKLLSVSGHRILKAPHVSALFSSETRTQNEDSIQYNAPRPLLGEPASAQQYKHIRSYFPEVWIWENIHADSSGLISLRKRVPDTLSQFILTGFVLDKEDGLTFSDIEHKIIVRKSFFIKLDLPYSIVNGEIVGIKVYLNNFAKEDLKAQITLENENDEFDFVNENNEIIYNLEHLTKSVTINYTTKPLTFLIKPKKIGELRLFLTAKTEKIDLRDSVEKYLLVKPQGRTEYKNRAFIINLQNDTTELQFKLDYPDNVVPDSTQINFAAIGDILGSTITNLNNLLRLPYGCGEQNLVNFVPNIIVLDYLKNAGKLTEEIKEKAIKNLQIGYSLQTNFQLNDGSFSAFARKDDIGSTWLTAFVVKSFVKARKYIFIDDKIIKKAVNYLEKQQNEDGSFLERGTVFSKSLQGGLRNNQSVPGITAYVAIALSETNLTNPDILNRAKEYLEYSYEKLFGFKDHDAKANVYILSLISYALTKLKSEKSDVVFDYLWKTRHDETDQLYFGEKINKTDEYSFELSTSLTETIEASAYTILNLIERNEIEPSVKILSLLISQQNSNGGFISTQDTVIAIEALAAVASRLYYKNTNLQISISSSTTNKLAAIFNVNKTNSLTYQEKISSKPDILKELNHFHINATGDGIAIVQVSWSYNVVEEDPGFYFDVNSTLIKSNNDNLVDLYVCVKYKRYGSTNMGVVEVQSLSGYLFDEEYHHKIDSNQTIRKIEFNKLNSIASLYFDEFSSSTPTCFNIRQQKKYDVRGGYPASIEVYDYYNNNEKKLAFYYLNNKSNNH